MVQKKEFSHSVSVVIIAKDSQDTISECLTSVFSQAHTFQQVILVDNNSKDQTVDRIDKFKANPNLAIITESSVGRSFARNTGLGQVTTEYVLFLDSDIVLANDFSLQLEQSLSQYPIDILIGPVIPQGHETSFLDSYRYRFKDYVSGGNFISIYKGESIAPVMNTACALVSVGLARSIGGFDTRLARSEDRDFSRRCFYRNGIISVNSLLVSYSMPTRSVLQFLKRSYEYGKFNFVYDKLWGDEYQFHSLVSVGRFFRFTKRPVISLFLLANIALYFLGYKKGSRSGVDIVPNEKLKDLKTLPKKKGVFKVEGGLFYMNPRWFFYIVDHLVLFVDYTNEKMKLDRKSSQEFLGYSFSQEKKQNDISSELEFLLKENEIIKKVI